MSVKPLDLTLPYLVADMAQADWGRKEMQLSENEMPGLMSVIKKYGTVTQYEDAGWDVKDGAMIVKPGAGVGIDNPERRFLLREIREDAHQHDVLENIGEIAGMERVAVVHAAPPAVTVPAES